MNPADEKMIQEMRRQGFVEYLASCNECGLQGMIMVPPGAAEAVSSTCPRCGEECNLLAAPREPISKWRWLRSPRTLSRLLALVSILVVVAVGVADVFIGVTGKAQADLRALAYLSAWIILFAAWWLRE